MTSLYKKSLHQGFHTCFWVEMCTCTVLYMNELNFPVSHYFFFILYLHVCTLCFYQGKEQASTKVALAVTTIQRYSFDIN